MDELSASFPKASYDRQDWVRAYLNEDGDCDRELSETLEDLQGTVQLMFDRETERRVREVERLSHCFSEASHTPAKRARKTYRRGGQGRETGNNSDSNYEYSSDEPELKPMPLFFDRRAVTYPGAPRPLTSSSNGSPRSASSSFAISTRTSATSVSPTEPLRAVKLAATQPHLPESIYMLPPPIPPPRNPARGSHPSRDLFPPRRSSLNARSLVATATPQNSPTTNSFPKRTSSLLATPDAYHIHLRSSAQPRPSQTEDLERGLKRAKSMAVLGNTPPRVRPAQRPSTGHMPKPAPSAPYMKMWSPPSYNPSPVPRSATTLTPRRNEHDLRKRQSFRQTLLALHKSASASSLSILSDRSVESSTDKNISTFDFRFKTPAQTPRHDSFSPMATTPTTPTFRSHFPQNLRLIIPETNDVHNFPILGPVPSPARSDQLMLEIEDGLHALQCDSTFTTPRAAPQPSPSPKRTSFVRAGSIRRMATSAHKRLSMTFSNSNAKEAERPTSVRHSFLSEASTSPSWVTVPSSFASQHITSQPSMRYEPEPEPEPEPEEPIEDPMDISTSGGAIQPYKIRPKSVWSTSEASDITTTNTSSSFLASTFSIPPLRTKRSRQELEFQAHPYEGMTAVRPPRESRAGIDGGGRNLQKASKVLGLFEGSLGRYGSGVGMEKVEEKEKKPPKKKMKKEKSGGRGRWDEMFEVVSKAFELG